jgi:hypothetical protein
MDTEKALKILMEMNEREFQTFFDSLPPRVKLMVKGGMVDWKEVLPQWYINFKEHNQNNIFAILKNGH